MEVEQNLLNKKLKTITAYYGELIHPSMTNPDSAADRHVEPVEFESESAQMDPAEQCEVGTLEVVVSTCQ